MIELRLYNLNLAVLILIQNFSLRITINFLNPDMIYIDYYKTALNQLLIIEKKMKFLQTLVIYFINLQLTLTSGYLSNLLVYFQQNEQQHSHDFKCIDSRALMAHI